MHLFPIALTLLLAVAPARASTILYATDATTNGVDGFCIRGDGSLAPTPSVHVDTVGTNPRRLVVGPNHVLYVAEAERVEAYRIGPHGALMRVGSTPERTNPSLNALDVAVSTDGSLLYVPDNGRDLIATYPLDADGAPAKDFSSCVKGTAAQQVQRVIVQPPYLYAAAFSLGGRIMVYPVDPNGALQSTDPNDCLTPKGGKAPPTTCPVSERRNISKPRGTVVAGDFVYVASIYKDRVLALPLTDGLFTAPVLRKTGDTVTMADVCANDAEHTQETPARRKRYEWEKASSRTAPYQPYQEIVVADDTVYAAQYRNGRVDAFRLRSDGNLPKHSTGNTKQDFRGTPVGLAVRDGVLYVAGGEFDSVRAFRLAGAKALPDAQPFSFTDEQKNTFPNALAVADLDGSCP